MSIVNISYSIRWGTRQVSGDVSALFRSLVALRG